MTEARPTDLVYGHLGDPIYDTETQQWHFPRRSSYAPHIVPLGSANVVHGNPLLNQQIRKQDAIDRREQAQRIIRHDIQFTPAIDLLLSHAQLSEAVVDATASYEPTASELLGLGTATSTTSLRHEVKVPIVAFVAGPAGEILLLSLLRKEQLGWDLNKAFGVHQYTARGGEKGWWRGNGSAIQQICFATNAEGEGGSSVAVRYQGAISIFQPTLRSQIVSPNKSAHHQFLLPASRLDPHEVLRISTQSPESTAFADVSFNPWDHEQFATIGQTGVWCIWDLEGKGGDEETRRARRVQVGRQIIAATPSEIPLELDGWARILWACDFRTLLIARRRSLDLMMIDISPRRALVPDLSLANSEDWIVDVKRSPANPAHIFLVTSTRLFWLSVTITRDDKDSTELDASISVLLCWVHYRSPTDISLHLDAFVEHIDSEDEDNTYTRILLYSRLTSLVTVYTFQYVHSQGRAISMLDPYILPLAREDDSRERLESIDDRNRSSLSTLVLRPLTYGSLTNSAASGLAQQYMDEGCQFYQLTKFNNNLEISERLYVQPPIQPSASLQAPRVRTRRQEPKTPSMHKEFFFVPDGIVLEETLNVMNDAAFEATSLALPKEAEEDPRTINLEWLVQILYNSTVDRDAQGMNIAIGEALDMIKAAIQSEEIVDCPGSDTLLELVKGEISISDINDTTTNFNAFFEHLNYRGDTGTAVIDSERATSTPLTSILTSAAQDQCGLSNGHGLQEIYESLIQVFVSTLPADVPSRNRVILDRSLRNISLQLYLASLAIRPRELPVNGDKAALSLNVEPRGNLIFDLPMRRKASAPSVGSMKGKEKAPQQSSSPVTSSSQLQSSIDPMRSFSQHSDQSTARASTRSTHSQSTSNTAAPSEDPASERLRASVRMTPQPAFSTSVSSILAHWTVGADPADYDWAATQNALAADTEGDDQTEPSQSKKSRRKKRLMQKNIEDWSATRPLRERIIVGGGSQPAPAVLAGSQPTGIGESSQTVATQDSGLMPMSQPLRGRFGARKEPKKKKRRKEGF